VRVSCAEYRSVRDTVRDTVLLRLEHPREQLRLVGLLAVMQIPLGRLQVSVAHPRLELQRVRPVDYQCPEDVPQIVEAEPAKTSIVLGFR
jgi:hypothetical protein